MRYYAQYSDIPEVFASDQRQAWMVFDRDVVSPQGDTRPIILCVNRYIAFKTRDALNEQESRK